MTEFIVGYYGGKNPTRLKRHGRDGEMEGMGGVSWRGLDQSRYTRRRHKGPDRQRSFFGCFAASPYGLFHYRSEDMEGALHLLKDCPHLHYFQGTLEVSEMMGMPE